MNIGKIIISIVSASLFIAASVGATQAFPRSNPLPISGDRGGYVIEYALRMLKLKQSRRQVAFRGSCDSACTIYLALPRSQVCVTPQSSFTFHKPYGATGSGNQIALEYMMNAYPGWVRMWISSKGGLSSQPISMSYSESRKFLATCGQAVGAGRAQIASK